MPSNGTKKQIYEDDETEQDPKAKMDTAKGEKQRQSVTQNSNRSPQGLIIPEKSNNHWGKKL